MGLFSRLHTRLGHFVLSHLLTERVVTSWKSGYVHDPLPDIAPTARQDTDKIRERDLERALQEHRETRDVPGLHPPRATLSDGTIAGTRWRDYQRRIEAEETREISAIELQEELLKRLGGQEG